MTTDTAPEIQPYATGPRAPFPVGSVPRAAWFCIEPTFDHPSPALRLLGAGLGHSIPDAWTDAQVEAYARQHGFTHEVATPDTLATIAANFDPAMVEGRGLLVTINHSSLTAANDSRAAGWIKALHADGDLLWAWIEWTPWGHSMINNAEFIFFSTEYNHDDFLVTARGAEPQKLAACTCTNENRHKGQIPCTNTSTKPNDTAMHRANSRARNNAEVLPDPAAAPNTGAANTDDDPNKAANSETDPNDPPATNSETDPNDPNKAANTDPNDPNATACNSDGDIGTAIQSIASLLQLPATAGPADLLAAVEGLINSNEELQEALAEANAAAPPAGSAANSARRPAYPYLMPRRASNASVAQRSQPPARNVNVRMGARTVAINSQTKAQEDYIAKRIGEEERARGRALNVGEYTRAHSAARLEWAEGKR